MEKKNIKKLKEKLEKEKIAMEQELGKFAKKDRKLKDDWDTRFPEIDGGIGGQLLEDAADQVEEYATLLPIEHILELRLKNINLALERIKKGVYGKCKKCKKPIAEEKLRIFPSTELCNKCSKNR